MTASTSPSDAPLERLSALAARDFADPGEAIAAILALARDLLGLTTALVTQADGEIWRALHVADGAFGLAPGVTLPLRDTFCSLVGADEPMVITDAPNDPRGGSVPAPAALGVRTFVGVPLVLRDGTLYGTLCALDKRASDLDGEAAVATLRILARLVVHELEHERHLAAVRDEEEQRFRALVQHASDGITVVGADGAVRYQSPAVARMLGYEPEELVGEDPFALIAPEDAARARDLVADLAGEPGGSRAADLRVRNKDGSWRSLEVTFTNLLADPSIGGVVVNTRDITERKRGEERLQEAEAKYRSLVENLPAVVYSERLLDGDPAAAARYVAPQVAALIGYSQAEWIANPGLWKSLLHPDDREAVLAAYERAERDGEPFRGEYRLLARDGRTVWVRDEAVQVRDEAGQPRFWQGVMLDISDRREAEARLREAEARYRTLVESLPAIVYTQRVAGDDLTTTYVSPQVEASLGYSPKQYRHERNEWTKRLHPDDRARALAEDIRTNTTGEPFRAEYRERASDGRWVWLRDEAVLVREEDGRPAYWLGVQFDVTERKRAEEALRASEERLRRSLEAAHTATWDWDVLTGELTWSSNVDAVVGLPVGALGNSHVRFLDLVHPDDRARLSRVDDGITAQGNDYAVEYRVVGLDGRVRWFADQGRTMGRDADGRAVRVSGVTTDVTARKAAEAALRESEERSRELAVAAQRHARELALLGEVRTALARELDLPALIRTAVEATAAAFGYPLVSLYLREDDVLVLQHQVGYERVIERVPIAAGVMGRVVRTGEPELVADGPADPDFLLAVEGITSEVCVPLRDQGRVVGTLILESRGGVVLDEDDLRLMLAVAEHVDVAIGRARLYGEARASEARFGALVRNAPDLITILDATGIIRYESPAIAGILGYDPDELIGENALALVHPDDLARVGDLFAQALARPGVNVPSELRFRHKDGSWRWLEGVGTNLLADPNVGGIVVNSRDATERKRAEEHLTHLAYHDPLTGLPNRALFLERLDGALARARRGADPVAVLFLDLDGFKLVNDSRGHHAGDCLLTEVGRRLRRSLGPGDTLARLGGDEFAVLLEGVADAGEGARAAERLIATLRPPVVLDDGETYVDASVGVAVSTRRRSQAGDLLQSADIALYRAKATGRGSFVVFEPWMQARVTERLKRENALRRALERDEIELHYQPIVELATGRIVAAEALVRWAHPEHGLLPPGDFIPAAEETGLIVPLGRRALREACRQAAEWKHRRPDAPPRVCVNLSVRQLREADFAAEVARALEEGGLDPGRLELEITETVAMADAPETRGALRALRGLGVRLAIDDFGTGYSSLGRLRDLAIDALKVDGSFVAGLGKDGTSLAIVRAVTTLAYDLGLAVTAEGVETAEQVGRLRALGVDLGQGFRFAPPLKGEAFGELLARGARLPEDPDVPNGGDAEIARNTPGARAAKPTVADGAGRGGEARVAIPLGR